MNDVDEPQDQGPEIQDQLILLAASNHDLESLRALLRSGSASVQDQDTGFTPLHSAIAACEASEESLSTHSGLEDKGDVLNPQEAEPDPRKAAEIEEAAAQTLKLLLQEGAIWNDLDKNNETPGCLALRLRQKRLYNIIVDAGVRAEILLQRLDEYQRLADDEEEENGSLDGIEDEVDHVTGNGHVDKEADGNQAEPKAETPLQQEPPNLAYYLRTPLTHHTTHISSTSTAPVMMSWEAPLMRATASLLAPSPRLHILNIGHGMGIIDGFFQSSSPSAHHIVEAHPDVLSAMKRSGWYDKENVTVHEGKWQDVLPSLLEAGTMFDAIYFDTFAEGYKDLRTFFEDFVIGLLEDGGKWGFFNGLGADRQVCYDVYGKVVEMDLFESGWDVEWHTLEVEKIEDGAEEEEKKRYWTLEEYRLPVCAFMG